ncbi:hypothetical protein [Sporosarcina sp. Te-1]|uniref:hypothetical protein n=1 Tax=Sporosarcina sp. Te-1 TaxID=2818390 RepID=UPI001A9FAF36|nr:hypothetical protein [Sporosarcina sp. Te-1]QTD39482.1 hypothetical protein J3U78_11425 [Sporosarcina sp. Te-1]
MHKQPTLPELREQTIKEQLEDGIEYETPLLARAIYYALQEGLVQHDDPVSLPEDPTHAHHQMEGRKLAAAVQRQALHHPLMGQKRHALYLATKENDALAKHFKIYGELAQRVLDVTFKIGVFLYCEATGMNQIIREMKRQAVVFSCYWGEVGR